MNASLTEQQIAQIASAAKALAAARVSMNTNIEWHSGGCEISVEPDEVPLLLASRERFIEKKLKVSYSDYRLWLERGGYVPCAGRTKSGRACRGHAPGRSDEPAEFAARCRAGELCIAHA